MRKWLMLVSFLIVSSAYADNVFEDPLDDLGGGWGANATSPITEGARTFSRISEFQDGPTIGPPWGFYAGNKFLGTTDISAGVLFQVDVRIHQEAPADAWLGVRLGGPGGEYFHGDGMFPPDPANPSGVNLVDSNDPHDVWMTVGFNLDLARNAGMDLAQFDGFEFFGGYGGTVDNATLDYFDVDNLVITPEPASLLLLGLGFVTIARRR